MPSCRNRAQTALPSRHPEHARPSPLAIKLARAEPLSHALAFGTREVLADPYCPCLTLRLLQSRSSAREPFSSSEKSGVDDGDMIPLVVFVAGPLLLADLRLYSGGGDGLLEVEQRS